MHSERKTSPALVIGALGVVFGDLGTSPLYALQECVAGKHGVEPTRENLFGLLSLFVWSLIVVVTIKYLVFLMRADNKGEGGILALLALLPQERRAATGKRARIGLVVVLALAGAALLFGDGIITPAISVLSAVEGLGTVTDKLDAAIVPLSAAILLGLFALQRYGTGGLGRYFGPVMLIWFVTAGVLGAVSLVKHPAVLAALSPHYGAVFLATHGFIGFRLLGGVVLAITGGEALYADMGHFGRRPIRVAWNFICLPSLLTCYLGQGARLLDRPDLKEAPFYALCPEGVMRYPFVLLAALATVIASQALISGVFSLTHQAIRLGHFPRMREVHTSEHVEGETYLPLMNAILATGSISLVLIFQSSAKLTAAFGLAVSGTMSITSILFYRLTVDRWRWSRPKAGALLAFFLVFDLAFTASNMLKFWDGGFIPLVVGSGFLTTMLVWTRGRALLAAHFARQAKPLAAFFERDLPRLRRAPGTAVYLASLTGSAPPALLSAAARFGVVHERAILLTVLTTDEPRVNAADRVRTEDLGSGFYRVVVTYGFFDSPNVPAALASALPAIEVPAEDQLVYILGRESLVASDKGDMGARAEAFFALLSRNSRPMTDHFQLPADQVLEIGSRVDL